MKPVASLLLVATLAGCAGLSSLSQASKPTQLYVLTPKSTFSESLPDLDFQIVVDTPTATAAVDTDQIAVQPTPLQVQYLPGARWVDRAPLIVQALLIESFENTGKVPAVGSSTIGLRADYLIVTDIREFQASVPKETPPAPPPIVGADGTVEISQAPTTAPLKVDVRLNIKLIDAFSDRIIGSRSFGESVLSPSDGADDVAEAFDEALGDTMRDAIEWSIRQIDKHAATQ